MLVTIQLTNYGDAVGPFNVYYDLDLVNPMVLVASDVSLADLVSGYTVDINAFTIRVVLENLNPFANTNFVEVFL
jgi:hypothetical protein